MRTRAASSAGRWPTTGGRRWRSTPWRWRSRLDGQHRGCQYTAATYRAALAAVGATASMSRSGDCLDNALAERFLATLTAEVAEARPWPTRAAARTAVFEWLEVWYNRQRRHSALNFHAPGTFEEDVLLSCPAA